MAAGLIVNPWQADSIVLENRADIIALGREALRDPHFPLHAEQTLGAANPQSPYDSWGRQIG